MHRAQLMLEEWQYEALKSLAESRGRSISEVARDIFARHLEKGQRVSTGKLDSISGVAEGPADLGENHDQYLYGKRRKG